MQEFRLIFSQAHFATCRMNTGPTNDQILRVPTNAPTFLWARVFIAGTQNLATWYVMLACGTVLMSRPWPLAKVVSKVGLLGRTKHWTRCYFERELQLLHDW